MKFLGERSKDGIHSAPGYPCLEILAAHPQTIVGYLFLGGGDEEQHEPAQSLFRVNELGGATATKLTYLVTGNAHRRFPQKRRLWLDFVKHGCNADAGCSPHTQRSCRSTSSRGEEKRADPLCKMVTMGCTRTPLLRTMLGSTG